MWIENFLTSHRYQFLSIGAAIVALTITAACAESGRTVARSDSSDSLADSQGREQELLVEIAEESESTRAKLEEKLEERQETRSSQSEGDSPPKVVPQEFRIPAELLDGLVSRCATATRRGLEWEISASPDGQITAQLVTSGSGSTQCDDHIQEMLEKGNLPSCRELDLASPCSYPYFITVPTQAHRGFTP